MNRGVFPPEYRLQRIYVQQGVVLPVCLIFLLLISRIAMSALDTSILNSAMAHNIRQSGAASAATQSALRIARHELLVGLLSHQAAMNLPEDQPWPIDGMLTYKVDKTGQINGPDNFLVHYEIRSLDASTTGNGPVALQDDCIAHHQISVAIDGQPSVYTDQYLCCRSAPLCVSPPLILWQRVIGRQL